MNIIGPLVQFQQQLRIFHWQTSEYSQHKAFGKAYENFDDLIDTFIETFMGRFGRAKPTITYSIELKSLTDNSVVTTVLSDFIAYLESMNNEIPDATDLLNIRDSMVGEVNHLKYLLSLK